ncbi:germ cell-less protein-like 1 [Phyllostomus discolor]|uniref:Germ cell-less protein-like 1 n=1 Tax=Phyllostomus discolor TaxID=89673 RepID=A0A7E6CZ27_9CHIR|nr:germ cell-less protein-like 1 [Phyllostomus discolor]
MATIDQVEEENEEAGPSTSQGGFKRKMDSGSPHTEGRLRKHARGTSSSIYEKLFLTGEGSDVQIRALGEVWNLHKAYLCQSGYFASMFSGAWREATMNTIDLQMPDENIDSEALHEVLGSLYQSPVYIPPRHVVSILATASMLQLDELIRQCGEVMKETATVYTVCSYYHSAESYGLPNIRTLCFQWLLDNLMTHRSDEVLLRQLSPDVMKELIASSELLVMEVEMDVYAMLKKWMYLQLQPGWRGPRRALLPDANLWLARSKRESGGTPFLETQEGRAFVPVFQNLRLAYIICDLQSARIIEQDALIPAAWLTPVYEDQQLALVQAKQSKGVGPIDIHVPNFPVYSMRCGYHLLKEGRCRWLWAILNFDWDLVVCYANRRIIFKRSTRNKSHGLGISLLWQRKVAFRLCVVSLDITGRATFRKSTEYQVLSLGRDEDLEVVNLEDQDVVFPIYVACNFLYIPREGRSSE